MSENRSLAVLEVLVHLSAALPDEYVLGAASIPDNVTSETIRDTDVPPDWGTLDPDGQWATRRLGDGWVARCRSALLSVPSVVSGERNYVLNPSHPDFQRIVFDETRPFAFDVRLLRTKAI
jgi:RES domain-containing protein